MVLLLSSVALRAIIPLMEIKRISVRELRRRGVRFEDLPLLLTKRGIPFAYFVSVDMFRKLLRVYEEALHAEKAATEKDKS